MDSREEAVVQGAVVTEGARRATGVTTGGASPGPRPVGPQAQAHPERFKRRRPVPGVLPDAELPPKESLSPSSASLEPTNSTSVTELP